MSRRGTALGLACLLGVAAPATAAAPERPAHRFQVTAGPGAAELSVEAEIAAGRDGELCVQEGYGAFVADLQIGAGRGRLHPARLDGACLAANECEKDGCRVRYRFRLQEAARQRRNRSRAFEQEGALLAPPGTWLLSPTDPRPGSRYRLSVTTPPGIRFVNGAFAAPGGASWEGLTSDLMDGPYAGFGPFETRRVTVPGGAVDVAIAPGERALTTDAIVDWAQAAATNVSSYFGRYPVPRALVIVLVGGRRAVGYGSSMGYGGASVMISVGPGAGAQDLRNDWVLTHEMSHFALPNLPRQQRWLEEGMATYVELVARTRSGRQPAEALWSELLNKLPNGAAAASRGGLDDAGGWAGTYWGGALYWFLADVAIREQTGNRKGLEHALRGIMADATIADARSVPAVLRAGDDATGTHVLAELYAKLGRGPYDVDVASLCQRLGVERRGGGVALLDGAPLAAVRLAISGATPPP